MHRMYFIFFCFIHSLASDYPTSILCCWCNFSVLLLEANQHNINSQRIIKPNPSGNCSIFVGWIERTLCHDTTSGRISTSSSSWGCCRISNQFHWWEEVSEKKWILHFSGAAEIDLHNYIQWEKEWAGCCYMPCLRSQARQSSKMPIWA